MIVDFDLFVINRTVQRSDGDAKVLDKGSQNEIKYKHFLKLTEDYVLKNIITVAAKDIRIKQTWVNFTDDRDIGYTREMWTELITNSYHQPIDDFSPNTLRLMNEARELDIDLLKMVPSLFSKSPFLSNIFDNINSPVEDMSVPFLTLSREKEIFLYIVVKKDVGTLKYASIITKNDFASDGELRGKARSLLELFDTMVMEVIQQKRTRPALLLEVPPSDELEENISERRESCWICLFC